VSSNQQILDNGIVLTFTYLTIEKTVSEAQNKLLHFKKDTICQFFQADSPIASFPSPQNQTTSPHQHVASPP
jgi:hypothetical protein